MTVLLKGIWPEGFSDSVIIENVEKRLLCCESLQPVRSKIHLRDDCVLPFAHSKETLAVVRL